MGGGTTLLRPVEPFGRLPLRILTQKIAVLASFLLCSAVAIAAEKSIDKRTPSKDSKNAYFLVFMARGGSPTGHAFVVWGKDDADKKLCSEAAFGFYPKEGKGVLGPVPGVIVDEMLTGKMKNVTDRLVVQVDQKTYEAAEAIRKKWADSEYKAADRDCVTFSQEVARAAGLVVPARDASELLPQKYMQSLINGN